MKLTLPKWGLGVFFISLKNYQNVDVENGACMGHLDICNTRYGKKKGWESNWQFDFHH
jgi:hypothetical protein